MPMFQSVTFHSISANPRFGFLVAGSAIQHYDVHLVTATSL